MKPFANASQNLFATLLFRLSSVMMLPPSAVSPNFSSISLITSSMALPAPRVLCRKKSLDKQNTEKHLIRFLRLMEWTGLLKKIQQKQKNKISSPGEPFPLHFRFDGVWGTLGLNLGTFGGSLPCDVLNVSLFSLLLFLVSRKQS